MTKLKGRDNVKQYLEIVFGNNISIRITRP